jgi:monoamine oxidase
VLIIGAGLSGLETARLLRQRKVETIILEARNRTGGRIWSVKSKNGHVFDMGAAWIHGINGSILSGLWSNPLWDLVREANIPTRGTLQNDLHVIYPGNTTDFNLNSWYGEYLAFVREQTKVSAGNITLQDYADLFIACKNFSAE